MSRRPKHPPASLGDLPLASPDSRGGDLRPAVVRGADGAAGGARAARAALHDGSSNGAASVRRDKPRSGSTQYFGGHRRRPPSTPVGITEARKERYETWRRLVARDMLVLERRLRNGWLKLTAAAVWGAQLLHITALALLVVVVHSTDQGTKRAPTWSAQRYLAMLAIPGAMLCYVCVVALLRRQPRSYGPRDAVVAQHFGSIGAQDRFRGIHRRRSKLISLDTRVGVVYWIMYAVEAVVLTLRVPALRKSDYYGPQFCRLTLGAGVVLLGLQWVVPALYASPFDKTLSPPTMGVTANRVNHIATAAQTRALFTLVDAVQAIDILSVPGLPLALYKCVTAAVCVGAVYGGVYCGYWWRGRVHATPSDGSSHTHSTVAHALGVLLLDVPMLALRTATLAIKPDSIGAALLAKNVGEPPLGRVCART